MNKKNEDFYTSEFAKYYDLILYGEDEHYATEEELEFLYWAFRNSSPLEINIILDAGCGTGRFLVPLAKKGYDITGIDSSSEMLGVCEERLKAKEKKADVIKMDIAELDSTGLFDAILCVDSVLNYDIDRLTLYKKLQAFHKTLVSQGILVIESWNVSNHMHLVNTKHSYVNKGKSAAVKIDEHNTYDEETGMLNINLDAIIEDGDEVIKFKHNEVMKMVSFEDMTHYLETAGFVEIKCFSGFDFTKPDSKSGASMIWIALKP